MSTYGWKFYKRLTVPASGTATLEFPEARPLLEKLTVWALSGGRSITGLSFQVKINGEDFGAAVVFAGPGVLAQPVLQDVVGSATENMIIPANMGDLLEGEGSPLDPFDLTIEVTDSSATEQKITMAAVAIGRAG